MQLSAFTMIGGAIPLLVVACAGDRARALVGDAARSDGPRCSTAACFALVIAYYFWYRGVRVIGPTRTAMYSNLQPVIAVLDGVGAAARDADVVAGRRRGVHHDRPSLTRIVKLVLFDIDGTILLTDGAGKRAIHRALIDVFGGTGPEDHRFDGKTDPQIVRELMRIEGHADEHIDAHMSPLLDRYVDYLHEELRAGADGVRVMPGVVRAARRARGARRRRCSALLTGNLERGRAREARLGRHRSRPLPSRRVRLRSRDCAASCRPSRSGARARSSDSTSRARTSSSSATRRPTSTAAAAIGARAIGVATGHYSVDDLSQHRPRGGVRRPVDTR